MEVASSVAVLPEGGHIVAGLKGHGECRGNVCSFVTDTYILRLSPGGEVLWTKEYDMAPTEEWPSVALLPEGGFVVVVQASGEGQGDVSTLPLFGGEGESAKEPVLLWNDTIQALVIRRLLEGIRFAAERAYRAGRGLNTLVLLDEAHRLAPRETPDNEELKAVRNILIDAVRTTRKYGVGWMFISQTLSSLHREIIGQLRIFFFGFGLGMGAEFKALSELVGGRSKALDLYQLFRDPHSSFDIATREYSFMTIGPVSPLSFAGTPLFFNAFNTPEEFVGANKLEA